MADDENNSNTATSQQSTAKELAREFRWVECLQLIINGVLAAIGIIALCIYHGQLTVMRGQLEQISKQYPELQKSADAAKESADLSRHVLEGTNAAIFRINEISPTYGDSWRIRIGNFGKVGSPKLDVTYSLIHERFPSGKPIGPVVKGSFNHAEVMPREENGNNEVVRDFRTPGFDKTSSQLINAEETFRIEGTFAYNNGFDRTVTEDFCWETYPFPYPTPSQVTWQPCDLAQSVLRAMAQQKAKK